MSLELVVRLDRKMPVQRGNSARGAWSKQEFIVETEDTYPKKICMSVWGDDKIRELESIAEGEMIDVSINIESREYNQRWYTDVRAWKIVRKEAPAPTPAPQNEDFVPAEPLIDINSLDSEEDDLPF